MSLLIDRVIAYYECEDATDSHSGGIDLTESNGPTYVTGHVGNGVDCDSTDQSGLVLANASAGAFQMGTGSLTVSFWFNAATLPTSGNAASLVHMGATNSGDVGWHVVLNNSSGTGQILARLASGSTLFSATASGYGSGAWRHVVAIWDRSGNMSVHIDGVRAASTSIAAASAVDIQATQDFKIGGRHGTSQWYDGVIDEVVIFDYAVPLSVVDWLYNDGGGRSYSELSALTTLGGRFRENFGSIATGTGTPAGFTVLGSTNTTFEVVTDAGSEGGRALEIQKSGSGRARLTWDELDGKTQQDIVMLFEVDATGRAPGLIINSTGAAGSETEYLLEAFDDNLTLWEGVNGSYTSRSTNGTALPSALTSGVIYAMRLRRQADTYYGRIWIPASEDEPAAWDVSSLDGSPRGAGGAGVSIPSSAGTLTVHYLSGAIGNDCGCVLPDSDFPDVGLYATSETDGSLRVYDEADASINGVVSIFGGTSIANVRACAVHMGNQTVFVAKRFAGPVVRVDRYGLNETVINDTIANPYGLDIDESADLLFITDRDAGQCYTDDIAGGNQANPLTVATASHVHWEDANSRLWWVADGHVYSGNASFGSSTDYGTPPATPGHAISDGTTMIVSDFDAAGADGVFSKAVASPGDAFATADGTSLMDAFAINADLDTPYGAGSTIGGIVKWTAYPPTAGTRSTFATLAGARYVDWFEFATGTPEVSGGITQGTATAGGVVDVLVQASGSLTQGGATVAGAADVIAAASGSLTQGAATLSGSAGVLVQVNGTLTQGGAVLAGVIGTPTLEVSGSLTQGAATVAGATDVLVQASGSLVQGLASLAGGVGVLVQVSGSLTQGGAVLAGNIVDPNNQIADIELSAAPLFNVAFSASPLFNIALTAEPRVT